MAITVNAAITPTINKPIAQKIDVNSVALAINNYSPHRLDLYIGSALNASIQPYDNVLFTGIPSAAIEPWFIIVPRYALNTYVPSGASNAVTATTYASGDTLPAAGTFTPGTLSNGGPFDFNPRLYGAVGNGVADDSGVFTALIAVAGIIGGARINCGPGVFGIGSTLNIGDGVAGTPATINNVRIIGTGIGSTRFLWLGATNGKMFQINGICSGNGLGDMTIDGNGTAAYGVYVVSAQYSAWGDLEIKNTVQVGFYSTANASGAGTNNTLGNRFGMFVLRPSAGTVGQQSIGMWLDGAAANSADTNMNDFPLIVGFAQNQYQTVLRLGFCDFNNIGIGGCFVSGTGSIGVELYGTTKAGFPGNNSIRQLAPGSLAVTITGTVGNNRVEHFDASDGAIAVPSGTGLFGWSDNPNGGGVQVPFGPGASTNVQASAIHTQLTTTGATNIVTHTLALDGLYLMLLYIQQTNATAVTVTALAFTGDEALAESWYFQAYPKLGSAATNLNAASLAQGSYQCIPIPVRFQGGATQKPLIQVTASVANVVFCTAAIVKIA